jgi:hypothetical protein
VIRRSVGPLQRPLLLIIPTAPDAVIRQVRQWLRPDVRRNLARYGAPLALADNILDHSLDDRLTSTDEIFGESSQDTCEDFPSLVERAHLRVPRASDVAADGQLLDRGELVGG